MRNLNEERRLTSKRDAALAALREAGSAGVLNVDLMRVAGSRAGGRVDELRALGHVITCTHVEGGLYRYVLHVASTPRPGEPGYLASLPVVASITGRRVTAPPDSDTAAATAGRLF